IRIPNGYSTRSRVGFRREGWVLEGHLRSGYRGACPVVNSTAGLVDRGNPGQRTSGEVTHGDVSEPLQLDRAGHPDCQGLAQAARSNAEGPQETGGRAQVVPHAPGAL